MHLHDAVDAFRIGRVAPGLLGLPAQQRMNAAIAIEPAPAKAGVGRSATSAGISWTSSASGSGGRPRGRGRWAMAHCGQVWASDADRLGDRAHRPSRGNEVERNSSLWDGPPLIT